jgi:hypothetical protein
MWQSYPNENFRFLERVATVGGRVVRGQPHLPGGALLRRARLILMAMIFMLSGVLAVGGGLPSMPDQAAANPTDRGGVNLQRTRDRSIAPGPAALILVGREQDPGMRDLRERCGRVSR